MAGQKTPTTKLWVSGGSDLLTAVRLKLTGVLILAAKAQKVEMDKLEKAKKERTKVSPTKNAQKQNMSRLCLCCAVTVL